MTTSDVQAAAVRVRRVRAGEKAMDVYGGDLRGAVYNLADREMLVSDWLAQSPSYDQLTAERDELRNLLRDERELRTRFEAEAEGEVTGLKDAIRKHRDQKGDDRCWMDDESLYRELPEGYEPFHRDSDVELANCQRFIACRHNPATEYVSPQRRIDELESQAAAFADTTPLTPEIVMARFGAPDVDNERYLEWLTHNDFGEFAIRWSKLDGECAIYIEGKERELLCYFTTRGKVLHLLAGLGIAGKDGVG